METGPTVDLSQECFKSIGIVSPHRTSGAYAREGLTCIPVPKTHDRLALRRDLHLYHRKIKRIISHKIGIKIKMPWRQNSLYPLTGSLYGNRWTLRWGAALDAMILNLTPNSTSKWRDCSGRQICPILCQLLHEWIGKGCVGEMSLQTFLLPPLLRWRYRGLVVHTEEFIEFLKVLNDHRASIKVKNTLDPQQVNFLDTTGFFWACRWAAQKNTHMSIQGVQNY